MTEQNRFFMIVVIALVALLGMGLLGIGAWAVVIRPQQIAAQAEPTAAKLALAETATSTATSDSLPPATSTPRPTNTPVVAPGGEVASPTVALAQAATATPVPETAATEEAEASDVATATPEPPAEVVPQTGFGPGLALATGIGLVGLAFVARRFRRA